MQGRKYGNKRILSRISPVCKEVLMSERNETFEPKQQVSVQQDENKAKNKAKREYKDTVFRLLFHDRKRALSLYNGIHGTDYRDESLLEYNTLENAIYMNLHNDISFVIANQIDFTAENV